MRCSALLLPLAIAACTPTQPPRPAFNLAAPEPSAVPTAAPTPSPLPSPSPTASNKVVAGAMEPGFADGPGSQARFSDPLGLALAPDGGLLVADRLNHRVRRMAPDGTVTTLAGSDTAGFQDGPAGTARFQEPTALAVDERGVAFVADPFNHCVRRVAKDGTVSTLVGGPAAGSFDGGPRVAGFDHPYALALDNRRHLFVAERFGNTLRMVTLDGDGQATLVQTIAGTFEQAGGTDGPGAKARFDRPSALAWDPRVADHTALFMTEDHRCALRRVDVGETGAATVSTLNKVEATCGNQDGPIPDARFGRASALLVDPTRGLLLADAGNGTLRAFLVEASTPLTLSAPGGLAPAPDGQVYATDGNRIRRVAF